MSIIIHIVSTKDKQKYKGIFKMLKTKLKQLMENLHANEQINYEFALNSEEATNSVIVEPFCQILGYKSENFAEFRRDIAINYTNSKADYGIYYENQLALIIKTKKLATDFNMQDLTNFNNLFYKSKSQFAILTNGLEYRFFTCEEKNNTRTINNEPFFIFNLKEFTDTDIQKLENFKRENFNPNEIIHTIEKINILESFKSKLLEEIENPSINFVNFFIQESNYKFPEYYQNHQCTPILKDAMEQIFNLTHPNSSHDEQASNSQHLTNNDYDTHFNKLAINNLKNIMNILREYIFSLDSNIGEKTHSSYIGYYANKNFIRVFTQAKSIKIYLRLNDSDMLKYEEYGKKLPDGHRHGLVQFNIQITENSNLEKIKEMILVAYEYTQK